MKIERLKTLEDNNELLENYFRNTIIAQLFIDAGMRLQKYTPPVIKEFTITENDIGKHIDDIKENFRFEMLTNDIRTVMENGELLEKEVETTDGRWYQMNIIPYIVLKEGRTNGVIITFVDITKRMKAFTDLEQVIADHEILLDTLSHDIWIPLTTLQTAFQLIQEVPKNDAEQVQKLLLLQTRSLNNMQRLVY